MIGILEVDEEKQFGKIADNLVDWTKFGARGLLKWGLRIVEGRDDQLFTLLVSFLDNKYGDKIPVDIKPAARAVALAVINGDLEELEKNGATLLATIVDIPDVSEDSEALMATALLKGIIDVVTIKLKKEAV